LGGSQFEASQGKKFTRHHLNIRWEWWCVSVIPAMQRVKVRRFTVPGQSKQQSSPDTISTEQMGIVDVLVIPATVGSPT
jgi:hypothetical protein